MQKRQITAGLAGVVAGLLALSACGGGSEASDGGDGAKLDLVGFSILEASNAEQFKAFQATDAGKGIEFLPSYGVSGDQSRGVEAGKSADIVHFSLEPDI